MRNMNSRNTIVAKPKFSSITIYNLDITVRFHTVRPSSDDSCSNLLYEKLKREITCNTVIINSYLVFYRNKFYNIPCFNKTESIFIKLVSSQLNIYEIFLHDFTLTYYFKTPQYWSPFQFFNCQSLRELHTSLSWYCIV